MNVVNSVVLNSDYIKNLLVRQKEKYNLFMEQPHGENRKRKG